jgi:hypothetical protein
VKLSLRLEKFDDCIQPLPGRHRKAPPDHEVVGGVVSRQRNVEIESAGSDGTDDGCKGGRTTASLQPGYGGLSRPQPSGKLCLGETRTPTSLSNELTACHVPIIPNRQ